MVILSLCVRNPYLRDEECEFASVSVANAAVFCFPCVFDGHFGSAAVS